MHAARAAACAAPPALTRSRAALACTRPNPAQSSTVSPVSAPAPRSLSASFASHQSDAVPQPVTDILTVYSLLSVHPDRSAPRASRPSEATTAINTAQNTTVQPITGASRPPNQL